MKKKGGRGPDYVQERMGHTCWSFSHGMTLNSSHSMILNSNTAGDILMPYAKGFRIAYIE